MYLLQSRISPLLLTSARCPQWKQAVGLASEKAGTSAEVLDLFLQEFYLAKLMTKIYVLHVFYIHSSVAT